MPAGSRRSSYACRRANAERGFSRNQANYSRSTKLTRVVPAEAFTTLAIPMKDDRARHHAESIVHLGSRQQPRKLHLTWPVRDLSS